MNIAHYENVLSVFAFAFYILCHHSGSLQHGQQMA
jgi:hypothetical protein